MTNSPEEIPVTENRIEKLTGLDWYYSGYFGNEDEEAGSILLAKIALKLRNERKRQPLFAEGPYHALGKIEEDFRQSSAAVLQNDPSQRNRAIAIVASLVRFLNNEHHPETCGK